jgi:tRNA G18 (ribose-2'-O)-methylase SpoU
MALVVGSEATGLSAEVRADPTCATISIPLAGGVESLNAAVAGSIALFEARRQRDATLE